MHHAPRWVAVTLFMTISACAGEGDTDAPVRDSAAQRRHDSIIGASRLPGASGVSAALRTADSAAARRLREDSVSRGH